MLSTAEHLTSIRTLIAEDLAQVDQLIHAELNSKLSLIQDVVGHIIRSGGKRIRPILVLLVARALEYKAGTEHHELAAIIEFIHTSTLLHDDVVDDSALRRGQDTANHIWGNSISVLIGDFLYSRVFQMLAQRSHAPVMRILADTTHQIAEGEVMQLMYRHNSQLSESEYLEVIYRKTAKLFEAAAEIGALLSKASAEQCQAAHAYGKNLGMAFQILDDVLDYQADSAQTGKNLGDDLAEGKMTLPLIYALQQATAADAKQIRNIIQNGDLQQLSFILSLIQKTQAPAYCLQKADEYATQARQNLSYFPNNPFKQGLEQLIDFVVNREY